MRHILLFLLALMLSTAVQLHAQDNATPQGNPASQDAASPQLTQSVTSEDGMITVAFPEHWRSKHYQPDTIGLTNKPELIERGGLVLPERGEIYIQITYVKRSRVLQSDGTVNLHNLLMPITERFTTGDGTRFFSEPEAIMIGEHHASHTLAELVLGDEKTGAYALAVDRPESRTVIVVTTLTAADELGEFLPVIHQIAGAVKVEAHNIPHVVTDAQLQVNDVVFRVPEGWFGRKDGENGAVIASSGHLLEEGALGQMEGGDVMYYLTLANRAEILPHGAVLSDLAYATLDGFGDDIKDGIRLDVSINGFQATGIAFTVDEKHSPVNLYYLFVDFHTWNQVLVVVGVTRDADVEELVANALEIVKQIDYEVPTSDTATITPP